jgi:HD-like signal output (HDOD) protein
MPTVAEIVGQTDRLVTLPAVYLRVRTVVDDPRSSVQELAQVIAADPALTARLLKVVNSVRFGLMRRVDSVASAVSILGMQPLHDLVLAASVASAFRGIRPANMDMPRFWRQSVLRGLVAQEAAEACRILKVQRLFVAGLLADIGHLVMYQGVPELAERALLRAQREQRALHEVEAEVVGCHYAEVGGAFCEKWQLPRQITEAIAAQVHPDLTAEEFGEEAAILHFARVVVDGMAAKHDDADVADRIDPFVWRRTRLNAQGIVPIRETAENHFAEVMSTFFPELRVAA